MSEKIRNNLEALKTIQVFAGENLTVPLSELATFRKERVISPIFRENSKRRSAVLINPRGRDVQSLVTDAQEQIQTQIKIPEGYRVEWFGSFKNLQEAKKRLWILGPLAFLLVALMIYWAFQSTLETIIVLATVPLALVGGVIGLTIAGLPFSISAAIGFIALSGIAVLNGVVLVHYFNELRVLPSYSGKKWVIEGAQLRLRPVLMTALVDIFGFIPMAISSGVGSEVQKPIATVVIGGVITSTTLTLIVLPLVSSIFLKDELE
jgi:cobalt-zinc-cadmium resistance protein CzcA